MELSKLENALYTDICKMVEEARMHVAATANQSITLLYWKIGERIHNELFDGQRAEYGCQIVTQLATHLPEKHLLKAKLHKELEQKRALWINSNADFNE